MVEQKNNLTQPVGLFRLAQIVKYDAVTGKAKIKFATSNNTITTSTNDDIYIPNSIYSEDGLFIGGLVKENTPIMVGRAEGGKWYFVSFVMNNSSKFDFTSLIPGQLLIKSSASSKITLDINNNILLGSDTDRLHLYTNPYDINDTLASSTFDNFFNFTESTRSTNGIVKRETEKLPNFPPFLKLKSDDYTARLTPIGLDPTATKSATFIGQIKNPPFAEKREMVYEFAYSYNVQDDLTEGQLYSQTISGGAAPTTSSSTTTNRRQSRADTLSLSLVAPNYLMETVKGTVIDIFGNILDINRYPIPIGSKGLTLKPDNGAKIPADTFNNIKAAERKSVAFHYELNARKDLGLTSSNSGSGLLNLLDINSTTDYARARSRFFFDIDKEGQFKLNIPASSETGNVSLLARYENYSTFSTEQNNNPNQLIYRPDNLDIFLDSFSYQEITIMDGNAVPTPKDRITGDHIMKGMPYHAIMGSLGTYQPGTSSNSPNRMQPAYNNQWLDFQYNEVVDLLSIPVITNVVSPTINVSGSNANAGGRSGSAHFDGSFEFSVGANTVDRQSLWLDTAGSLLANLGRDKNNVSAGLTLDGDLMIQIGGTGISNDSRFSSLNNAYRGGTFDIRVLNNGFTVSIIRIDKNGITIATPNTLTLKARDITISAEGNLILDGDNVSINERAVTKWPTSSI